MKYRKLLALCAAILCMACMAPGVMAKKHTVYFVDNGIGISDNAHRAYIYNDKDKNNVQDNGGWPGGKMTKTEYLYQGKQVYSYSFNSDFLPTGVIFNNGSDSKKTKDLTFTNGALYVCNSTSSVDTEATVKFDPMCLFGNINGYGDNGWNKHEMYRAHQDGEGNFTFTLHIRQKSWFRFYYNNNTYTTQNQNNVTLTTTTSTSLTSVGDKGAFVLDQGDYTIKVQYLNSTLKILSVDKESAPSHTIYVNFGHPLIDNGKRNADDNTIIAPKIFLSKNGHEKWDNVPKYGDEGGKSMTLVSETLYKYELTDDELYTTCDFVCEFQPKSGDTWRMWAGNAANFDNGNLTKFIYYQGSGTVEQSYITYDQYIAAKNAEKETIYLVGNGFDGLNGFNIMPDDMNDPNASAVCIPITGTLGVFYKEIKQGGSLLSVEENGKEVKGAQFKMSWLRPYSYWDQNGRSGGAMDYERSWATFNLGIIGYNQEHEVVTSKKLPVIISDDANNPSVFCTPSRTIPMDNINQSNWFIREKYISDTDTYSLLVDFGNDYQTVTLLPFRPNPTLNNGTDDAPALTVENLSLEYDEAEEVSRTAALNAEAANGEIRFTDFNVAVLSCTLNAPSHDKISSGTDGAGIAYSYKVVYDIYFDGKKVGEYADKDKPSKIKLVAVDPATANVKLGVRGRYTDQNTGLTFRSNYDEVALSASVGSFDYETPTIAEVEKTFAVGNVNTLDNSDKTARSYTLGAFVNVKVDAPATNKVWYADFKLSSPDGYHSTHKELANGGEVVYAGHMAESSDKSGTVSVLEGFAKYAGSGAYDDSNNWSRKLAASQSWPLYLQDVVEVKRTYDTEKDWQFTETPAEANVKVEVSAVYPFLINNNAKATVVTDATPATQNVKAAPCRVSTLAADGNYSVKLASSEPATSSVSLGNDELTGVRGITADPASGISAPEYYTIQGVRVTGPLAPGIYICRRGASAEKIMIR